MKVEIANITILQTLFSDNHPRVWNNELEEHYVEIFIQLKCAHYEVFGQTFEKSLNLPNVYVTVSQLANVIS